MPAKTSTHPPVPIFEVAARAGMTDEMAAKRATVLGSAPDTDWAGRLVVPPEIAARIVAEHQAETDEWTRLHGEYAAFLRQREHDRAVAWQESYRSALAEATRTQIEYATKLHEDGLSGDETGRGWARDGGFPVSVRADPRTDSIARTAASEARKAWEKKNPEYDFEQWRKKVRR